MIISTPIFESVLVAAAEGIPTATSYPPHHPDIYGQLCSEIGRDPRTGEQIVGSQGTAGRSRRRDRPAQPAQESTGGRRRAGAHALPWWRAQPAFA